MKKLRFLSSILFLVFIMSSCKFTLSEGATELDLKEDKEELLIAKKSLMFIANSESDSLYSMLSEDILEKTQQKDLDWLMENGKRIIDNNQYPNDSLITVSRINVKTMSGENIQKEFSFPFHHSNPDSTMYFRILVVDQKISKLFLSAI